MVKKVAFIGLGNMGSGMAANLVRNGFEVCAFDLSLAAQKRAQQDGCSIADSATNAVVDADYIISMLPNGTIVESVYLGNDSQPGLLSIIANKSLIIDCSTIAPDNSRKVGEAAKLAGLKFIDAPVSGGVAAANAGTLAFMVGGAEQDFQASQEVLNAMGGNIFRAGDVGAGQTAKICNNMLLAIHMAGTAEALQLGVDNGLDPAVLSEIMLKSSGCNWSLEKYNPMPGVMDSVPAANNYQGGFMVDLMLKDLGLAMETSLSSQSSIPMGAAARNLYNLHKHSSDGDQGGRDFSSIQGFYGRGGGGE